MPSKPTATFVRDYPISEYGTLRMSVPEDWSQVPAGDPPFESLMFVRRDTQGEPRCVVIVQFLEAPSDSPVPALRALVQHATRTFLHSVRDVDLAVLPLLEAPSGGWYFIGTLREPVPANHPVFHAMGFGLVMAGGAVLQAQLNGVDGDELALQWPVLATAQVT